MIYKSLEKQKSKTVFLIFELTLGFLIMFLILGSIEHYSQAIDKSLEVIKPNIFEVYWNPKGSFSKDEKLTMSFCNEKDNNQDWHVTAPKDTLNILKSDRRIKSIGKTFATVINPKSSNKNYIQANVLNLLIICNDYNASKFYNYKIIKGKNFVDYYKNNKDEVIPILIGPPLEKKNPIGSIVEIPYCTNPKTKKPLKFRVIGVLDPSMPTVEDSIVNEGVDNNGYVVIMPKLVMYNKEKEGRFDSIFFELRNLKDAKFVKKELSNRLGYCDVDIQNESKHLVNEKKGNIEQKVGIVVYSIIMLILSSFGIISISLSSLMKRKKEIGVRFAMGAKKSHIIILLCGEFIGLFIISGLISLVLSYIFSKMNGSMLIDLKVIGFVFCAIFIFMIISILPLLCKLFKLTPIQFIKEE